MRARIQFATDVTALITASDGATRIPVQYDEILNGDTLRIEASTWQYGDVAIIIQKRTAGAWADSIQLTLKVRDGNGLYRTDQFIVSGNTTNSTVTQIPLADRGSILDGRSHCVHEIQEGLERSGVRLTYSGNSFLGIITKLDDKGTLGLGGYVDDAEAEIVTSRQQWYDLSVTPVTGKNISAQGVSYRIISIESDSVAHRMTVRSVNR